LRVAGLVEERLPVVAAADRLDDEHHAAGHLDRGAERSRRLLRPRLEVEVDVLLRAEVDAEVAQRRLERGHHPVAGEGLVPFRRAEEPRHVPGARVREADAEPLAEEPVAHLLPPAFGLVEELTALVRELVETEAEPLVELVVVRRAEPLYG